MWVKKKNNNKIDRFIELPKYYKNWAGNFDTQSNEIHVEEGFIKVPDVVINTTTQYLGGIIEISEGVFEWEIIDKPVALLVDLKENHKTTLVSIITEVAGISSVIRNIYDPLYVNKANLPDGVEELLVQIQPIRTTSLLEIDALLTIEDAQAYIVRTPEIETFISDLKVFI